MSTAGITWFTWPAGQTVVIGRDAGSEFRDQTGHGLIEACTPSLTPRFEAVTATRGLLPPCPQSWRSRRLFCPRRPAHRLPDCALPGPQQAGVHQCIEGPESFHVPVLDDESCCNCVMHIFD